MGVRLLETTVRSILTRTHGYLTDVCSHSLQPYRGCSFGNALCGVGCYVQHNGLLTRGERWGSFLEVRRNSADAYARQVDRERRYANGRGRSFSIFMSSVTDPFVPQERTEGITGRVLDAMIADPPDALVVQTHSPAVLHERDRLCALSLRCDVRVHVSIEGDLESLPGLPAPAASVARRLDACSALRSAGLRTVVTVAPLLPMRDPHAFFERIAFAADAVVIDHFIGGDGSPDGSRTARTRLPDAMEAALPGSSKLAYREHITAIAKEILPGRVGVGREGFAGVYA